MTRNPSQIEVLDASQLTTVAGGGLLGTAWKAIDGAYHVAKPILKEAAPFGYVAYKAHSIWHKLTR
ncbi:MAG TPA: hypothetical protein VHW23_24145 [Kofleriaceae bacterium]|nr:hypothetical protein [Kofleriaceae bacterium]